MQSKLVQLSVVVPGKSHNPTILNPDFLSMREIVPASWGWELSQAGSFTTPAGSQVVYANRVAIFVDQSRLQVMDSGEDLASSKALDIAKGYVRTLPHIPYSAVGINFQGIVETDRPKDYLKSRFLKTGPWETETHPVVGAGVRFLYSLPGDGELVLSLDAAQIEDPDLKPREVVLISGNSHRTCRGYPLAEKVLAYLDRFNDDLASYQKIVTDVFADTEN